MHLKNNKDLVSTQRAGKAGSVICSVKWLQGEILCISTAKKEGDSDTPVASPAIPPVFLSVFAREILPSKPFFEFHALVCFFLFSFSLPPPSARDAAAITPSPSPSSTSLLLFFCVSSFYEESG